MFIQSLLLVAFITTNVSLCVGINLDCDLVKASGKCNCDRENLGWKIQCNYFQDKISLSIHSPLEQHDQNKADLNVTRLPTKQLNWEIIEGVDLRKDELLITSLMFDSCNIINDGFLAFLQRINLNGSDIQKFGVIRMDMSTASSMSSNILNEVPKLETLVVNYDKLKTFPDLSSLEKLESLNFDYNELENIPRNAFANNRNLTELSLNHNKLSVIEDRIFPDETTKLDLSFNRISSLSSASFANLKALQVLNMDGNPLFGLNPTAFNVLITLKELSLHDVYFRAFPQLTNLINLETLKVRRHRPFTNIPLIPHSGATFLRDLPNLRKLHLRKLDFTTFPKLKNISNLAELDLSENWIQTFPSKYFFQFPKLQILDVSKNRLTDLNSPGIEQLTDLNLEGNELSLLNSKFFAKSNQLVKIDLANNEVSSITNETFALLSNLTWLDLSDNFLSFNSVNSNFGNNQSPFKNNLKLQTLLLKNNRIDSICDDWRILLNGLTKLDLQNNKITNLTAKDLSFAQKNITVFLHRNPITHIDMDDALVHLSNAGEDPSRNVFIILDSNIPLNCDCQAFHLKNFRSNVYNIYSYDVICATPVSFKNIHLRKIKDKDLKCQIKNDCPIGCKCWQRPVDFTILIDCANKSRNISKFGLPQIDDINNLRLNRINWKLDLDLSGNEITELTDSYVSTFSLHLRMVNLSDNQFTSLSFLHALKDNSATNFSLANNPFPCEDCLGFQKEWRHFSGRLDVEQMTCIFKNESESMIYKLNSLDVLQDKLCPDEIEDSNQIHYFVIVASILFILVLFLIIIYLTREKMKRQHEMKEIVSLLNGRKTNEDDEAKDDPLHFLFDTSYEIKKNSFLVEKSCLLGSGEFGEVYKGLLHGVDKIAAFKTVRNDRGKGPLKALVSETKILMYIGPHEHLVTLLGVYREEITSGVLYVAIEYCEVGSLESFLRRNKSSFTEYLGLNPDVECEPAGNTPHSNQSLCNIKSLLMWSEQIASAMEYLGAKNVVHSDLATRNVLLTSEGNAKVTDFGLSRRTYNYTEYIKTAKDPLPWRWLAIESLLTNTFSVKSDVWAYGITLWEIFSLGDIPYPGMAPTMEFVQELERGLRNFKPKLATDEIYDIMMRCWDFSSEKRPTFSSMKIIFNYAVSNGPESLEGKVIQEQPLDDIADQFSGMDYTILSL